MANPKTTKIRLLYERAEREMQQTQPRSCKQCMKPLIGWSGEFCCDWCRSVWLNNHDEGDVIDGYSPNGVRRPCKCCCQIPEVKARNEQRKSEMRAYLDRASSQLLSEGYTLIGMRFVKSDQ